MKRMLSWESGGTEPERGRGGAEAGNDVTVQILSQFFPSLSPATRMHGPCNEDLRCASHVVDSGQVETSNVGAVL